MKQKYKPLPKRLRISLPCGGLVRIYAKDTGRVVATFTAEAGWLARRFMAYHRTLYRLTEQEIKLALTKAVLHKRLKVQRAAQAVAQLRPVPAGAALAGKSS